MENKIKHDSAIPGCTSCLHDVVVLICQPLSLRIHMLQVVEDDLVAARQSDRSLGSQEFSRLVAKEFYNMI